MHLHQAEKNDCRPNSVWSFKIRNHSWTWISIYRRFSYKSTLLNLINSCGQRFHNTVLPFIHRTLNIDGTSNHRVTPYNAKRSLSKLLPLFTRFPVLAHFEYVIHVIMSDFFALISCLKIAYHCSVMYSCVPLVCPSFQCGRESNDQL